MLAQVQKFVGRNENNLKLFASCMAFIGTVVLGFLERELRPSYYMLEGSKSYPSLGWLAWAFLSIAAFVSAVVFVHAKLQERSKVYGSNVANQSSAAHEPQLSVGGVDSIGKAHQQFSRIFLGGIPSLLNDTGAFLSFVCVVTATETLAGYRYPDAAKGERFRNFVAKYFPESYGPFSSDLWKMRNGMVRAFQPGPFILTHHNSHLHMSRVNGQVVLNAEDFYSALVIATNRLFEDVSRSSELQAAFHKRLNDPDGGMPSIVAVSPEAVR